jgi:glycosyltransferase involved in cell wall biosynthesis
MTKPFFSIVTSVLNGEKFITETINSIKNQKFTNFEYIVVDGGSTDNTLSLLKKNKNFINKIIIQKDHSMYEGIKKGFQLARGKYYLWLNSDDFLFNNVSLLNLYNYLKKKNFSWVTGRISFFNQETNILNNFFPLVYPNSVIKMGLAHSCGWGFIQQENTVFSAKLYKKCSGVKIYYKQAGDFYLWKDFANYEELKSINISIAVQRKWNNQMTVRDKTTYFTELKISRCNFNIFYPIRFLYSLILYPIIYFRK